MMSTLTESLPKTLILFSATRRHDVRVEFGVTGLGGVDQFWMIDL